MIETKEFPTYISYMNIYLIITCSADLADKESELLFPYHNEVVKDYLEKCLKIISSQPKDELINLFIKQTENINFLLYWVNRAFIYLDRFYTNNKHKGTLSGNEMNLYKEIYFKPLKDDIYKELNKLIKPDRNGNKESRNKIKFIMRILNNIDIYDTKITKKNNKIIWVPEKTTFDSFKYNPDDNIYNKEWYDKYFKEETIQFVKEKVEKEIKEKSVFEFILSQLKYLEAGIKPRIYLLK